MVSLLLNVTVKVFPVKTDRDLPLKAPFPPTKGLLAFEV